MPPEPSTGRRVGRPAIGTGYKLGPLPIDDDLRRRISSFQTDRGIPKIAETIRRLIELGLAASERGESAALEATRAAEVETCTAASRITSAIADLEPIPPSEHVGALGACHWQVCGRARDEVRFIDASDLDKLLHVEVHVHPQSP